MNINLRVDDVFINHDHPSRRWHASVVDDKLGLVAVTYGETKEEATALAALIVHSVSNHDRLLAAGQLAWDVLTRADYPTRNTGAAEAITKLDAAVRSARPAMEDDPLTARGSPP